MKIDKKTLITLSVALLILLVVFGSIFLKYGRAATNIDPTNHWAWNDIMGWIDFYNSGVCQLYRRLGFVKLRFGASSAAARRSKHLRFYKLRHF
jgi:hypothetical protein